MIGTFTVPVTHAIQNPPGSNPRSDNQLRRLFQRGIARRQPRVGKVERFDRLPEHRRRQGGVLLHFRQVLGHLRNDVDVIRDCGAGPAYGSPACSRPLIPARRRSGTPASSSASRSSNRVHWYGATSSTSGRQSRAAVNSSAKTPQCLSKSSRYASAGSTNTPAPGAT